MGHYLKDTLKAYWSTAKESSKLSYGKTTKRDRFYHTFRYLHFTDNRDERYKRNDNFDRMWKMTTILDMLNDP